MNSDQMEQEEPASDDEAPTPSLCLSRHAACTLTLRIPFGSCREAEIARCSLQVDPEPKRSATRKLFTVADNVLTVEIISPDVRELRIATNSFMDLLHLVCKTITQFGPPVPVAKKICQENSTETEEQL